MAIDVTTARGRSLLLGALAQSDVDMDHHQLLNLDTSNLIGFGAPPTIHPEPHKWLHDWDNPTHTWIATQPSFSHISGLLTRAQQDAITHVGIINTGTWQGEVVQPTWVPTLDLIRAPVNNLSLASKRIVNMADPVNPQDAVTKHFMDFLLQGLQVKEAVRLATFAPTNLFGLPMVDGVQTVENDRVLVKNRQSEPHKIGIWVVHSGSWVRSTDMDNPNLGEFDRAYCTVREGTQNAGTSWVQVNHCENVDPDYPFEPKAFILFSTATGDPGPPGANGQGVPAGGLTHQVLRKIDGGDYNTEWADPEGGGFGGNPPVYSILQTGILPTIEIPFDSLHLEGKMAGFAGYFTPHETGKVIVTISGFFYSNSAAGAVTARMTIGTGTAPATNTLRPIATSVLIGPIAGLSSIGANKAVPFSLTVATSTLTAGIQFWFDLQVQPVTTGSAFVGGAAISAYEIA